MKISIETDVQWVAVGEPLCDTPSFHQWASAAVAASLLSAPRELASQDATYILTVRLVDEVESSALNEGFRSKSNPTNVLAFPAEQNVFAMVGSDEPELGDLIICLPVVVREASDQNKPVIAHLAHMVVHGTLHLLGFDHISEADADIMEALEVTVLASVGYSNPYQIDKD
jgi:probable rRNA maturation factor